MSGYMKRRREFVDRLLAVVNGTPENWDALLADALELGINEDQATAIVLDVVVDKLWHEAVKRHLAKP